MPMRSRSCRRRRRAAARPAFAVSFSTIDASVTAWRTRQAARRGRLPQLRREHLLEARDHQPHELRGVGVARQRVGFRKQVALEILRRRIEVVDRRRILRRLRRTPPRCPSPCDSKIFAISAIVSPSGNVTLITNTSPRAILSMTSNGVIARSNRYSPAFRCRPWPLSHNASADRSARSRIDAGRDEPIADRRGCRRPAGSRRTARAPSIAAIRPVDARSTARRGGAARPIRTSNRNQSSFFIGVRRPMQLDVRRSVQIVLQDDRRRAPRRAAPSACASRVSRTRQPALGFAARQPLVFGHDRQRRPRLQRAMNAVHARGLRRRRTVEAATACRRRSPRGHRLRRRARSMRRATRSTASASLVTAIVSSGRASVPRRVADREPDAPRADVDRRASVHSPVTHHH